VNPLGDQEETDALAGSTPDHVGDGGDRTDSTNLARAHDAEGIHVGFVLLREDCLELVHVGFHRHMIARGVRIHDAPCAGIVLGSFVQDKDRRRSFWPLTNFRPAAGQ